MDNKDELKYSQVGDIRIKEPKKKKLKKKAVNGENNTPFLVKIFVWFMFFAMLLGFVGPLVYYLLSYMSQK